MRTACVPVKKKSCYIPAGCAILEWKQDLTGKGRATMAGEHAGHRQRMRQRFIENGLNGFADHEVLELVLFYAIPQRNVNPLAHRLMERFGSLQAVLDAPLVELCRVEGVGECAAALLQLFSAVAERLETSLSTRLNSVPMMPGMNLPER